MNTAHDIIEAASLALTGCAPALLGTLIATTVVLDAIGCGSWTIAFIAAGNGGTLFFAAYRVVRLLDLGASS